MREEKTEKGYLCAFSSISWQDGRDVWQDPPGTEVLLSACVCTFFFSCSKHWAHKQHLCSWVCVEQKGHRRINSGACECWTWGSAAPLEPLSQLSNNTLLLLPDCSAESGSSAAAQHFITQGREGKIVTCDSSDKQCLQSYLPCITFFNIERTRTTTLCNYSLQKKTSDEIKAPLIADLWSSFVVNCPNKAED